MWGAFSVRRTAAKAANASFTERATGLPRRGAAATTTGTATDAGSSWHGHRAAVAARKRRGPRRSR